MSKLLAQLLADFCATCGVEWELPADLCTAAEAAIAGCGPEHVYAPSKRRAKLSGLINRKLRLNKGRLQSFLDEAAGLKVSFNYHEKAELLTFLDECDVDAFERFAGVRQLPFELRAAFSPTTPNETIEGLAEQLRTGAVTRSDARDCGVDERRGAVLRSLFGSFVFCAFPDSRMHMHFNRDAGIQYLPDYYQHLSRFHPDAVHRNCAMIWLVLDENARDGRNPEQLRNDLLHFVREAYARLSNHCCLAVQIKPFREGGEDGQWNLFSDLILYAEKHREVALKTGYFQPSKIAAATKLHIKTLDVESCRFDIAQEGFFYRDCIALPTGSKLDDVETTSDPFDILLLFVKNERDEKPLPCPGCRSIDYVNGNSYPSLGVRSWECRNPICPERSAFDRGCRYSLESLIKQEAILSDVDQIPAENLRRWKLDVVAGAAEDEVEEMLLSHFSLHGDTVLFVNRGHKAKNRLGRRVVHERFSSRTAEPLLANFNTSCFFRRFIVERPVESATTTKKIASGIDGVELYQGDCFDVLLTISPNSVDDAVTSPPYYNARSYSTWPNIYCYLYDMYNAARMVYRVLKPGGTYLFNIFDYFDNENNVVFSAMGKKRMILGAYIINCFRRIGFALDSNTIWHKGQIEGKRNFNQGNRSPYYQLPFNCWEHVLVFRKPSSAETKNLTFPTLLAAAPVFKMIRGENVLGHTAPFPRKIPDILLKQMKLGQRVLDPYSGSMTTARAAHSFGISSLSIDLHLEYCELGLRLLREENQHDGLFRSVI